MSHTHSESNYVVTGQYKILLYGQTYLTVRSMVIFMYIVVAMVNHYNYFTDLSFDFFVNFLNVLETCIRVSSLLYLPHLLATSRFMFMFS